MRLFNENEPKMCARVSVSKCQANTNVFSHWNSMLFKFALGSNINHF